MSDFTSWYVGMKVVCVDGKSRPGYKYSVLPEQGAVYTVRSISTHIWANKLAGVGVRLTEILRPGSDTPWFAERFRPIQTRKTDISVFTDILRKAEREIEDAPMQVQLG